MSIDKSLSQYQQLVKKGKGNRRPGYRGDDWGGPSYGGSSSSSSGGDRSHDRGGGQHQAAAQRATPAPSPHRDDSAERAAQAAADALNAAREAEARESAREKAIQVAALTPKKIEPVRSPHSDTPLQVLEQQILDTTKPTTPDILPEFEKRGIKTITGGSPHTEGPIDRIVYQPTDLPKRTYDPRTDPNALLDRGGIFSNFDPKEMAKNQATKMVQNKIMKELGLTALNPFIGIGSWLLGKFAPGKKAALTEKLKSTIKPAFDPDSLLGTADWQGEKKRTTPIEDRDGIDIAKQVAGSENVIAKYINQFAGTEVEGQISSLVQNNLNLALRHYADMTSRIEKGYSPNRQEMDVYKLLEHYLNQAAPKQKSAAYGGRIDKPLMGRNRDI